MSSTSASNGVSALTIPLIIDGKEEVTPLTFPIISPYTSGTCWNASCASSDDAVRAVTSASAAFPAWSATKPTVRRDILLRAADILEAQTEENASYMRMEMGADVGASQFFVVPLAIRMLRDIAGRITSICGSIPVVEGEGQSAMVFKEPMGVILAIVPWNAPYVFGLRSAACALAGGNTTVIKSSELSPRCYWAVAKAFLDAGLPKGCLNLISCSAQDAPAVVEAMVSHEAVRKVNFTGSASTGRKIASLCGRNLKPCLMELGGKNSAIVCADADLQTAVGSVIAGSFLNSGQICMSTDRILVHKSIAERFVNALKEALAVQYKSETETPTLVSEASKTRVKKLVSEALSAGAILEYGIMDSTLEKKPGVFMRPLLIGNAKQDMSLWQEELFSSVAAYMIVDDDDHAIRVANQGGYGLSAAVFTGDLRKGLAIAKRLESGAVHINSMTVQDEPALPFGGIKDSGWGRFNAKEGLEEFLVTKTVTWMD